MTSRGIVGNVLRLICMLTVLSVISPALSLIFCLCCLIRCFWTSLQIKILWRSLCHLLIHILLLLVYSSFIVTIIMFGCPLAQMFFFLFLPFLLLLLTHFLLFSSPTLFLPFSYLYLLLLFFCFVFIVPPPSSPFALNLSPYPFPPPCVHV